MANDKLFKELCRPEIIRIGWHLAQGDSRDDFVRDPVGHADYASNLSDRLYYLIEQVQSHRYRPRHLIEVDVPKSGLSVRPGNVLPIEEASILHSIIYLLAPKLDKKLFNSVYSYRLHPEWDKKAQKGESLFLQLLFRIMSGWTRSSSAGMPVTRGIPQGNDVSSFLGNIYLIPLDRELNKFCESNNGKWFRYVDDVKIYTRSEQAARKAVFIVNEALRALHLNLQGSKTEILSGERFHQEHDSSKMDRVNEVFDQIRKIPTKQDLAKEITKELNKISAYCKPFTNGVPEAVRGLKGKENRLFRRLLATYGIAGRTRKGLMYAVFTAISELPDLRILRSCLSYLMRLDYKTHGQTIKDLLSALEAGTLLFPYQIPSVLEAMVLLHPMDPKGIGSSIRSYAFGFNLRKANDWFVIQKAMEALMTFPYQEKYILRIALCYIKHENTMVRRAAVALLTRAPKHLVKKHMRELTRNPDADVLRLAQYFDRLCSERDFSQKELTQIRKGRIQDNTIIKRLPQLYAASATDDPQIALKVIEAIKQMESTKSSKLKYHYDALSKRTKWSIEAAGTGKSQR